MKNITIKDKNFLFIEIPYKARIADTHGLFSRPYILEFKDGSVVLFDMGYDTIIHTGKALLKDETQVICTTDYITEEIANKIIPKKQTLSGIVYPHYPLLIDPSGYYHENHWASVCTTALESFNSLLKSMKLDENKNYLIIQK